MRAYYAGYNGQIYELSGNDMTIESVENSAIMSHSEITHMIDRKYAKVGITISNMDAAVPTNGESFVDIKNQLSTDNVKNIEKLSPVYRVYVEYSLVDETTGTVVDEGVGINEVKANAFIFPLGITNENEFVSRLGLNIDAKIEKSYRDIRPFGVMRMTYKEKFILYIKRIYVLQLKMSAFTITPVEIPNPNIPHIVPPEKYGYPPHWNCTAHTVERKLPPHADNVHPSIPITTQNVSVNLTETDYVMIYDTLATGLVFDPIVIDYKPSIIGMEIHFNFLDPIIGSKEEVDFILEENNTPVVENPTITPDDSETNSESGTENPDPTGSEEGTNPETGTTPSDTDTSNPENTETSDTEGGVTQPESGSGSEITE